MALKYAFEFIILVKREIQIIQSPPPPCVQTHARQRLFFKRSYFTVPQTVQLALRALLDFPPKEFSSVCITQS